MTNPHSAVQPTVTFKHDFDYVPRQENTYEVVHDYVIPGHFLPTHLSGEEQFNATQYHELIAQTVLAQFYVAFKKKFQSPGQNFDIDLYRAVSLAYSYNIFKALYGYNSRFLKPNGTYANNLPAVGRHCVSIQHFVEVKPETLEVNKHWFMVSFGPITEINDESPTKMIVDAQLFGN